MKSLSLRRLTFAALVAAVYAVLTIVLAPISYGPIQCRISEVLCILPFFLPYTAWGLFVGCIIANLLSPVGVFDVIFGSLATLGCCLCTAAIGRRSDWRSWDRKWDGAKWAKCALACFMPVIWNAVIIGALLALFYAEEGKAKSALFFIYGAEVGLGELIVMYVLGLPLMRILPLSKLKTVLDRAV